MSIVLLGGHERMRKDYEKICKEYGCKVKVFNHSKADLTRRIGNPDYMVILTTTICHKAVNAASKVCNKRNIPIVKLNNSSAFALREAMEDIS